MALTMKKLLSLLFLIACGPVYVTPDPCSPASFNEIYCQQAITAGGYYYQGSWYDMSYSHPYNYYYGDFSSYRSRGGRVQVVTPNYYSGNYSLPRTRTVTPYTVPRSNGSVYSTSPRTRTTTPYTVPRSNGSVYSTPRSPTYTVPRSPPSRSTSPYTVTRRRP
jgi:hypothetical protein